MSFKYATHCQTLLVKREPTNSKDSNAVGVYQEGTIVGHVPYNLAPRLSQFLRRDVYKAFAEVTGEKLNRGGGGKMYINKMCTH